MMVRCLIVNLKLSMVQIIGLLIFLILVLIPCTRYVNLNPNLNQTKLERVYQEKMKQVGVNDYTYVAISNNDLAEIYYTEFLNLLRLKPYEAYQKLDDETKEEKFPQFQSFLEYSKTFPLSLDIDHITTDEEGKNMHYFVYDNQGNCTEFVASAIMNYVVHLS